MALLPPGGRGIPPLYVLMIVAPASQIGTTLYLASLPAIASDLHVSLGVIQLTITVYTMAFAASQLVLGAVADRYGRRRVLLAGLALYTLCSVLCAVAPSIRHSRWYCCVVALSVPRSAFSPSRCCVH